MAAQQESGLDGGGRLRGRMDGATWPVRNAAWKVQETLIWDGADTARGVLDVVKWPFENLAWLVQRRLLWPIQDSFRSRGLLGRILISLAIVAALAGVGVGGAVGVNELQSGAGAGPAPIATAAKSSAPAATAATSSFAPVGTSTLEGAPPNFSSAPAEETSDAKAASPAAALREPPPSSIPAAAAGEAKALQTARAFAGAFVLYEIGDQNSELRKTFSKTASPELAKALRDRPPRLPGSVDVPRARIRNVVLGQRLRGQVEASVSLTRLGNVSELRLTLTRDRNGWAVSEVRG